MKYIQYCSFTYNCTRSAPTMLVRVTPMLFLSTFQNIEYFVLIDYVTILAKHLSIS